MKAFRRVNAYLVSVTAVGLVAGLCYAFAPWMGYKVVALLLLLAVSVLAMLYDIWPVMVAALLSALVWNFFFIPPRFTFAIRNAEDLLLFAMYFVVASVNAVLTVQVKRAERRAQEKEGREQTLKLYNALFNSLSHELKTPIATIIGAVDALQSHDMQLQEAQKTTLLHEIDIAGGRLHRQVENLLSMSRLEAGALQLKLDWSDVPEWLHHIVQRLHPFAGDRSLHFAPPPNLPLMLVDAGLLEQVVYNLVLNALQHTPAGTTVSIAARVHNEALEIIVADDGLGFPEAELSRVWERFYRLPTARAGGSGLGLSIAQGFVEAHGGNISLENIESGGARFTVRVPTQFSYMNQLNNE